MPACRQQKDIGLINQMRSRCFRNKPVRLTTTRIRALLSTTANDSIASATCRGASGPDWAWSLASRRRCRHFIRSFPKRPFDKSHPGKGWVCSLDLAALKAALGAVGFSWIVRAGLAYTSDVISYIADKLNRLKHAHGM